MPKIFDRPAAKSPSPVEIHTPRASRVLLDHSPLPQQKTTAPWMRGTWPCRWIGCPDALTAPFVAAFRNRFTIHQPTTLRIHVTADERYDLFLNGTRIGRGSERGDATHWFFESYDLTLPVGQHTLVARIWALGERAPVAQISLTPGFYLMPDDLQQLQLLGTGCAAWDCKRLGGYSFRDPLSAWGTGARLHMNGADFDWGFESGDGDGWKKSTLLHEGFNGTEKNDASEHHQRLFPATLPPMIEERRNLGTIRHLSTPSHNETNALPVRPQDHLPHEVRDWQELLHGRATLTIPAHTRRRALIDLEDYYCAYPEFVTSHGKNALVRLLWNESLYREKEAIHKDNRDAVDNKFFTTENSLKDGIGDSFICEGGRSRKFETLWWECGRYVEILVETQDEPLIIESISLRETRYPLTSDGGIKTSDSRLNKVIPLALRTLQMCAHETYMDCPYYEQLMYIGDTRLQALTTYVLTNDDRLPRKALQQFDWSRRSTGLTLSRAPSRVLQTIPPFSLCWIGMVHDYAQWRNDIDLIRQLIPGVRAISDYFRLLVNADGLIRSPEGWNFQDWAETQNTTTDSSRSGGWWYGVPPDGVNGISGVLNWQASLAFQQAAELEALTGDLEMAARQSAFAQRLTAACVKAFWSEERGLMADDLAHQHFSEHSQCLAVLNRSLPEPFAPSLARGLAHDPALTRATFYFSHYLFDAYHKMGLDHALFERLEHWCHFQTLGLKTALERPEPSRSDCHAWSAHPLHHLYATILGVRPASMGFSEVTISPLLGKLTSIHGTLPHPQGQITVHIDRNEESVETTIELPDSLTGQLILSHHPFPLQGGKQKISVPQKIHTTARTL